MRYGVLGINYRTAALELRERLAFSDEERAEALPRLRQLPGVDEVMLISTCNRVELYYVTPDPAAAEQQLKRFLVQQRRVADDTLEAAVYGLADNDALRHIFRVTSSLDAMVVGEAQIMGQVKRAYAEAQSCATVGPLLGRCMQRAFAIAKRVRTETEIARHPASISSIAVDLAGRIFDDLSDVAVLLVGAGEMAELALTHLVGAGATRMRIANRSPERAAALAERMSGEAVSFDDLTHQLHWADVVITSTGSPEPIISKRLVAEVMKARKQRSLLIVDIAVPRDVDPRARSVANLYLFDVDDLEKALAANLHARRKEAKVAEKMISSEVHGFGDWLRHQSVVPLINQLRTHFSAVARAEAERTTRMLKLETPEQRQALERLADAIVKKLLHRPTTELKSYASAPNGVPLADATRKLFGFEEVEPSPKQDEGGATVSELDLEEPRS